MWAEAFALVGSLAVISGLWFGSYDYKGLTWTRMIKPSL